MNQPKRERGTGSLRLRNGVWWCRYYHRGRRIEVSCDTDNEKKTAKVLRHKLAEVETNTHADPRNIRFEDLRESYLADYETNKCKSLRHDSKTGEVYTDSIRRLDVFFCRLSRIRNHW